MSGFLHTLRSESGFVWVLRAAAAVIAWGALTVLLTLATLGAYALLRSDVLLDLHDHASTVAAVVVGMAAVARAARSVRQPQS